MEPLLPQLTHLGIYVSEIDRLSAFYSQVFNLMITDEGVVKRYDDARIIFLSATPTSHHQLVLVEWPKNRPGGSSNINQISFRVESIAQLREMKLRLERANVSVTPINHGNAMSLYAHDPEGNGLETYFDLPWYVAQPHGDPLDLSLSDEELMAQTEEMVQRDPTYAPHDAWAQQLKLRLGLAPGVG